MGSTSVISSRTDEPRRAVCYQSSDGEGHANLLNRDTVRGKILREAVFHTLHPGLRHPALLRSAKGVLKTSKSWLELDRIFIESIFVSQPRRKIHAATAHNSFSMRGIYLHFHEESELF